MSRKNNTSTEFKRRTTCPRRGAPKAKEIRPPVVITAQLVVWSRRMRQVFARWTSPREKCEITVACTPVTPAGGRSGSLHVPVLLSRAPRSTSISPSPATDWSSLLLTYPAAPSPTHRGNKSGQLWKSSVVPCGSGRPTQHHDGRVQTQTTHLSLPTTSPPCCPARAYSKPQAILGPLPRRSAHRSRHPLICHDAQPCPSPCDRRRISANDRFSLQQCPQAQQPVPGDET